MLYGEDSISRTRSDQLQVTYCITDHMTSDFDRERPPVLSSTVADDVPVIKVGNSSEGEQWSCYDDALSAMHGS